MPLSIYVLSAGLASLALLVSVNIFIFDLYRNGNKYFHTPMFIIIVWLITTLVYLIIRIFTLMGL